MVEFQLNRPIPWCPTLIMLLGHKVRRVDYPIHPRPKANTIDKDSPISANIRTTNRDGSTTHHTSVPVWDLPKFSWEDGCVREVIKAVNGSPKPSSRAHDFYLFETFILHENQEQTPQLLTWKRIGRAMAWRELRDIKDVIHG